MIVRGIDVSHWNGHINWQDVIEDDVNFVFMKASEGFNWHDSKFEENWQGASDVGLVKGAYHFFSSKDGIRQADNLLGRLEDVGYEPGDLLPVIDIENFDADRLSVDQFVEQISEMVGKLTDAVGEPPIIYTLRSFWRRIGDPDFSQCPLWVVDLQDDGSPRLPEGWGDYVVHQYSFTGEIDGIRGDVDLNRLNGQDLEPIKYKE